MNGSGFEFMQFNSILDFLIQILKHHIKLKCVCLLLTLIVHLMQTLSLKKYQAIHKVFIHYQCWTKSGIDHLVNVWHKHF